MQYLDMDASPSSSPRRSPASAKLDDSLGSPDHNGVVLDRLRLAVESYSKEAFDLRDKVVSLQGEVSSLQSSAQEARRLESALEQLEASMDQERKEWSARLQDMDDQMKQHGTKLRDAERDADKYRAEASTQKSIVHSLELELSRARREFAADRAKWTQEQDRLEEKIAQLESELDMEKKAKAATTNTLESSRRSEQRRADSLAADLARVQQ